MHDAFLRNKLQVFFLKNAWCSKYDTNIKFFLHMSEGSINTPSSIFYQLFYGPKV